MVTTFSHSLDLQYPYEQAGQKRLIQKSSLWRLNSITLALLNTLHTLNKQSNQQSYIRNAIMLHKNTIGAQFSKGQKCKEKTMLHRDVVRSGERETPDYVLGKEGIKHYLDIQGLANY